MLAVNPDDERVLRRAIVLLHMLGDRTGALRVYREFERRIAADYDLEPAPETQALISAIRSPIRGSVRRDPPQF